MREREKCGAGPDDVRILEPKVVEACGNKAKRILEYVGRVASGDESVSMAVMDSPSGWIEPPQCPDFDEFTVVLQGELHVTAFGKTEVVRAGQAVSVKRGVRVQYATPGDDGAKYVSTCVPAFTPDTVHRG